MGKGTELVGTSGYDFVSKGSAAARRGITALTSHFKAQKEVFTLVVYLSKSILSVTNVVLLMAFSTHVHLLTMYGLWKKRIDFFFFSPYQYNTRCKVELAESQKFLPLKKW